MKDNQIINGECLKCKKDPVELKKEGSLLWRVESMWLCSEHMLVYLDKKRIQQEKMMLEE